MLRGTQITIWVIHFVSEILRGTQMPVGGYPYDNWGHSLHVRNAQGHPDGSWGHFHCVINAQGDPDDSWGHLLCVKNAQGHPDDS